jgi:quinol monooxygenase YgiN
VLARRDNREAQHRSRGVPCRGEAVLWNIDFGGSRYRRVCFCDSSADGSYLIEQAGNRPKALLTDSCPFSDRAATFILSICAQLEPKPSEKMNEEAFHHEHGRPLLALALLLKIAFAPAADFSVLTFIEVRVELRGHTGNVLRQQPENVVAIQEIARPERFAALEHEASAPDSPTTFAQNSRARAFIESILDDLIAPPDQRSYRVFEKVAATSRGASGNPPANFFVITNIDIAPPGVAQVAAALRRLALAVRQSDGNLGIEMLQQANRPTQFALITAWISEAAFHTFTASVDAREFRRTIAPILDSPYDERLFRRVD